MSRERSSLLFFVSITLIMRIANESPRIFVRRAALFLLEKTWDGFPLSSGELDWQMLSNVAALYMGQALVGQTLLATLHKTPGLSRLL